MDPTVLFLGSFQDGALRSHIAADQGHRVRRWQQLHPQEWLIEQLDAAGGPGMAQRLLRSLGGGHDRYCGLGSRFLHVEAVLQVAPAMSHTSPLTQWSREMGFMREFYRMPLDAYSLQITDVRVLADAQVVTHRVLRHSPTKTEVMCPIALGMPLCLPALDVQGLRCGRFADVRPIDEGSPMFHDDDVGDPHLSSSDELAADVVEGGVAVADLAGNRLLETVAERLHAWGGNQQ